MIMEDKIINFMVNDKLSETTISGVISNLKRILNKPTINKLTDFKQHNDILKRLDSFNITDETKLKYISSILTVLRYIKTYKTTYKFYRNYHKELKEKLLNLKDFETKGENFIEWTKVLDIYNLNLTKYDSIYQKYKNKEDLTDNDKIFMKHFFIFSLYVLNEPRRLKDYHYLKFYHKYSNKLELTNDFNYIFYKDMKIIFNNYKTSSTYGEQIINFNDEQKNILRKLVLVNNIKDDELILLENGKFNNATNYITRILNKFLGDNISVNALRKSYLTHKNKDFKIELIKSAENMGTSTNLIINHYTKTKD